MARKVVPLSDGTFYPAKMGQWEVAKSELQLTQSALNVLTATRHQALFNSAWRMFVDHLELFWQEFSRDTVAVGIPGFAAWAAGKNGERVADELLAYLYESRSQVQHGGSYLEWHGEGRLRVQADNRPIKSIRVFANLTQEVEGALGQEPAGMILDGPSVRLPIINNKKKKRHFPPPARHLGADIPGDPTPAFVATQGYRYYAKTFEEAEGIFGYREMMI